MTFIDEEEQDTYTIIVLHQSYLSIYRNVGRVLCRVGEAVKAGQTIAIVQDRTPIGFELWKQDEEVNPEEVIML